MRKLRKILLFIPVWACLLCLSLARNIVCFPRVKKRYQCKIRRKIDIACQWLYSIVSNPYRIDGGCLWIPQYYLQSAVYRQKNMQELHDLVHAKRDSLNTSENHL